MIRPEVRSEALDAEELLKRAADVVAAGDARHGLHPLVARGDRDGVAAAHAHAYHANAIRVDIARVNT